MMGNDPWWILRAALLSLDLVCVGMGLLVMWHFRYLARDAVGLWRQCEENPTPFHLGLGIFLCALAYTMSRIYTIGGEVLALYEGLPLRQSWWQLWQFLRLFAVLGYWLHLRTLLQPGHMVLRALPWGVPLTWVVSTVGLWHMGRSAYESLMRFWLIYP